MIEILKKHIRDKKVLILGFGREGRSTLRRLRQAGGYLSVTISDKNPVTDISDPDISIIGGADYQKTLDDYDIVFKSPGVVLEKPFSSYKCKITSQTEIFMEKYRKSIIGITGTKGKSTTTTLIYHILSQCSRDCVLTGNIGIPSFDVIDDIHDSTVIVFELSCHQLENMSYSPHIAVFLNLFEEHLDHYGTFENYANAKRNIYRHQSSDDWLICSKDLELDKDITSHILTASMTDISADIAATADSIIYEKTTTEIPDGLSLVGLHNNYNLAVAFAVCSMFGIKSEQIINAARTYKTLPHRLEYVGEVNGVRYYDDSISTMCQSAIQAITSLKKVGTVIIGGMDRGIDYTELIEYLYNNPVPHIILISDSGKRIEEQIKEKYPLSQMSQNVVYCRYLKDAVDKAKQITAPSSICVLSPAAASYNEYKNFEQRGDCFKSYVLSK